MKAYLFDFDGTLVDSMPTFAHLVMSILKRENATYGEDILKIVTPLGYPGTARYFVTHCGVKREERALVGELEARALEAYTHHIPAKAHVREVLEELRHEGHSLNILTACPRRLLDPCLSRLGLTPYFDRVWCCADFGMSKSDVAIYRAAAKEMGRDVSDVIFLDDNLNADKTAKAAGMTVVGVYDASFAEYETEMRAVCHRYIKDLSELLAPALIK